MLIGTSIKPLKNLIKTFVEFILKIAIDNFI